MNRKEQRRFTTELIRNVRAEIMQKFQQGRIPDDWDGFELREYIAEIFDRCRVDHMRNGRNRRKRDYENEIIIRDL